MQQVQIIVFWAVPLAQFPYTVESDVGLVNFRTVFDVQNKQESLSHGHRCCDVQTPRIFFFP